MQLNGLWVVDIQDFLFNIPLLFINIATDMRNNVKIEAPSIYKDFGLGDGVLCMAIDNFATEVIIKRSESDALALRGKYKSAEIQSLAEQILGRFRACCAIKDSVDILLNCRVPEAFSSSASVAVALYQGLVMLFHTGKTHEEIYEDLVSDEGLMKLVSRHEIYSLWWTIHLLAENGPVSENICSSWINRSVVYA